MSCEDKPLILSIEEGLPTTEFAKLIATRFNCEFINYKDKIECDDSNLSYLNPKTLYLIPSDFFIRVFSKARDNARYFYITNQQNEIAPLFPLYVKIIQLNSDNFMTLTDDVIAKLIEQGIKKPPYELWFRYEFTKQLKSKELKFFIRPGDRRWPQKKGTKVGENAIARILTKPGTQNSFPEFEEDLAVPVKISSIKVKQLGKLTKKDLSNIFGNHSNINTAISHLETTYKRKFDTSESVSVISIKYDCQNRYIIFPYLHEIMQAWKKAYDSRDYKEIIRLFVVGFINIYCQYIIAHMIYSTGEIISRGTEEMHYIIEPISYITLISSASLTLTPFTYWSYRGIRQLTFSSETADSEESTDPTDQYTFIALLIIFTMILGILMASFTPIDSVFNQLSLPRLSILILFVACTGTPGIANLLRNSSKFCYDKGLDKKEKRSLWLFDIFKIKKKKANDSNLHLEDCAKFI